MKLAVDLARLVVGKVAMFVVVLVLVFAARSVVTQGPELARVAELEA